MALTDAQMADARRYMGYGINSTTTVPITGFTDRAYLAVGMVQLSLDQLLTTLTPAAEALIDSFITELNGLEQAITGAGANLDTASAGPWTRNPNEVRDRTALFKQRRCDLCDLLGVPRGPSLCPNTSIGRS